MAWERSMQSLSVRLCQSCWHGFFQDKCHHCDCPEKLWAQDWSNGPKTGSNAKGFSKAEKGDMHGKTFAAGFVLHETVEEVVGVLIQSCWHEFFRGKLQQRDCPETLCAQDWSNGVQMLGNGTLHGRKFVDWMGFQPDMKPWKWYTEWGNGAGWARNMEQH